LPLPIRADSLLSTLVRKNYYYGQFCYGVSADRMNRIFKKYSIDFTGNTIHNFGRVIPGARIKTLPLKYFVHHCSSYTAKSYIQTIDRYTDTQSSQAWPATTLFHLVLSSGKLILVNLLLRRGYRGGRTTVFLLGQMGWCASLSRAKSNHETERSYSHARSRSSSPNCNQTVIWRFDGNLNAQKVRGLVRL
jgi:hypothetical protein